MNRIEINEKAKEMIRGNKWYIWKPAIILALIGLLFSVVGGIIDGICDTDTLYMSIFDSIYGIISIPFLVGYTYYCLAFARGQKMDWKEIFNFGKAHWVVCILASLLMALIILAGTILLIIPGIIAAIGLTFWAHVISDNPELSATDVIKTSWEITKGRKMEVFVFFLSFIGRILLTPLTLGILYIWLAPYMIVAEALFYDQIKK